MTKKVETLELMISREKVEVASPSEPLHPLERKYGKEPKIDPKDLWYWH